MLGAAGIVDRIARAEIVQPVRHAWMLAPGKQQRIDQPLARDRGPLDSVELRIDEADVERRVVNYERCVADEGEKFVDLFREERLVGEELGRQTMHGEGFRRHVTFGIEVAMKSLPSRHAVE